MKIKYFLLVLFILPVAYADSGSIKLLAISEQENGQFTGSLADLYLAVSSGAGRIYIESFPFSKLDTQFSTRLARDVACDYASVDCSKLDFFYTIRADSAIVGGPSAGDAATILAISVLTKTQLDNTTAITGTINSGGIIGSVGGLKEKIASAQLNGINKVLVPYGSLEEGFDLVSYGKNKSIDVVEVSDLDEALYYFTGKERKYKNNISVDKKYETIMHDIADDMCNRSMQIVEKTLDYIYRKAKIIPNDTLELEKEASDLYLEGVLSLKDKKYYSAASKCFGANVRYREFDYKIRNLDKKDILSVVNYTSDSLLKLDEEINQKEKTYLSDLEAYMIIKERIVDAELNLIDALKNSSIESLSYAVERTNSALMWSRFFDMKEKRIKLDKENLKEPCLNKLMEVNDLYRYSSLLFPDITDSYKKEIELANSYFAKGDYELCLFKAAKVKADINVLLSSSNTKESHVDHLVDSKIDAAKKAIIRENEKGIFPIIGYSYYEYAGSLREKEKYLALVYAEYGLELSNLDVYFKEFKIPSIDLTKIDENYLLMLVLGVAIGSCVTVLVYRRINRFRGRIKFKRL